MAHSLERRNFLRVVGTAGALGTAYLLAPDAITGLMKQLNKTDIVPSVESESHKFLFGVSTNSFEEVLEIEKTLERKVDIINIFHTWPQCAQAGTIAQMKQAYEHGSISMVSWRPDFPYPDETSIGFRLNRISDFENYIRETAVLYRDLGFEIYFRMGYEMNDETARIGPLWNSPIDFIDFWKYTRNIFVEEGASNVKWIWCVKNRSVTETTGLIPDLSAFFPGDDQIDMLAADVYFRHSDELLELKRFVPDLTPEEILAPMVSAFRSLSDKPWIISEINGLTPESVGEGIDIALKLGAQAIMPFLIKKTGPAESHLFGPDNRANMMMIKEKVKAE